MLIKFLIEKLGPLIENHDIFPEKINVNFAQIIDPNQIGLIVWERGAGLTKACGSGASAVAYAGYKLNMVNSNVDIKLPGGILNVSIDEENYVYKSGPAELEYIEYYTGENINEE
jgi:diaminopimelate epimerase